MSKKHFKIIILLLTSCVLLSAQGSKDSRKTNQLSDRTSLSRQINPKGMKVSTRVKVPQGFKRIASPKGSYQAYLQNFPLSPHGTQVKYYDGKIKASKDIYFAVINRSISPRNLEQCADSIMRFRAEYLFSSKRFNEIQFNFLSDQKPRSYLDYADEDRSYSKFLKYMNYIFAFANTVSLYDELKGVNNLSEIQIGDIFIQKNRSINHAMMVLDLAVSETSDEKIFILCQSYMPAQETQIVINPGNNKLNPWYSTRSRKILKTPEWTFYPEKDHRRF